MYLTYLLIGRLFADHEKPTIVFDLPLPVPRSKKAERLNSEKSTV
jgi:hypothetical protein